jgi:hypothetical protein
MSVAKTLRKYRHGMHIAYPNLNVFQLCGFETADHNQRS